MRADPPTPAKGNTPVREISPLRGRGLDQLTSALPYPRSPALCRKDTTYPWSNRLRSHYNMVMMMAMMMVMMVMVRVMVMVMMMAMMMTMMMMVMLEIRFVKMFYKSWT